ncbi:hypothetical protein [Shimazuella alba]|uniref:Uncharacterized protein n=1 Tax=Shimazuella alba TaxID=2690964 RepID=A0A6I4VW40_9BACL|nr:hypothetical protein [Shimazuella alba]MXQ52744.1 hypothetical protein [Shimazuella alba]
MEKFMLLVAIISFGLAIAIFIANILNYGLKGDVLSIKRKSSKWIVDLFLIYMVSFSSFSFPLELV